MIKRLIYYGFFIAFFMVIFGHYLTENSVLMTTDAVISGSDVSRGDVMLRMVPHWHDAKLLGFPRGTGTQVGGLFKFFVNGILWNNLTYGLACLLASFFFLKRFRSVTPWAAILGAITAFWLGTNFSLIMAGHYFKPFVVLFFICSIFPASKMAAGSFFHALIWGSCIGLMFAQQPDVALFFALFASSYLVFKLWNTGGFKPLAWLKVLGPAMVMALLFAAGPLLSGYKHNVKATTQMQTQSPVEKWNYVTQWSVPPNEVIDFVAPGYYGWRSGEPEGPYWGRTGRSADWEKTGQGFRNFKMESTYIGIIPVGFAIFALFACRRSKHRAEILFWAGAAVVALLLSFGRYFPLYSLFYKLPVVNNIRNPNKFIQVFQLCIAILAAYGMDALWRSREDGGSNRGQSRSLRAFFWSSLGAMVILGMWALVAVLGQKGGVEQFVLQGWSPADAQTMVQNRAAALLHAVLMSGVMVAVFALFSFLKPSAKVRWRAAVGTVLVLLVAGDAVKLSKHYITAMPLSYVKANALTDFLHTNLGDQRVALPSQQGVYNIWATYLLPYNNIPMFNFTQMPRMPEDYKALLAAGSKNPLRMWEFSSVKYLLAPAGVEVQLPANRYRKVFAYDLIGQNGNEFAVVANPNGAHAVFESLYAIDRYALTDKVALPAEASVLSEIFDPTKPFRRDLNAAASVRVLKSRAGKIDLEIEAESSCTLRVSNRWDEDWKATVDGRSVDVERADFICLGVPLEAGNHRVILKYAPSCLYFYLQVFGMIILLVAIVMLQVGKHEKA
jgi:hypothetical protein